MKLGLFIPTNDRAHDKVAPSIWIRVLQLFTPWQSLNVDVKINHFFQRYDCVIVYRSIEISTVLKIIWLKFFSKLVFYDQVVNVFQFGPHVTKKREIIISIISKIVDGIICTTPPIELSAKTLHPTVFRVPEGVDLNHFSKKKSNINFEKPKFIWSGASHKALFLNSFSETISNQIILITNSDVIDQPLDFNYDLAQWNHDSFPSDILNGDIALLPRDLSSVYNQGHSEFKALVFAVSGLPIIANKLESYSILSQFYDGIVFLEDYDNNINLCLEALKLKSLDTTLVRKEYDVNNLCRKQFNFLQSQLNQANTR